MQNPLPPLEENQFGIVVATEIKLEDEKTALRFERVNDQVVMHLSVTFRNSSNIILGPTDDEYPTPLGVFDFGKSNNLKDKSLPSFFLFEGAGENEVMIRPVKSLRMRTDGDKREHGVGLVQSEVEKQLREENLRLTQLLYELDKS